MSSKSEMHNATLLRVDLIAGLQNVDLNGSPSKTTKTDHKENLNPKYIELFNSNLLTFEKLLDMEVLKENQEIWTLLSNSNQELNPFSKRLATVLCLSYIQANDPEYFVKATLSRQDMEGGIRLSRNGLHFFTFPIGPNFKKLQSGMNLKISYTADDSFMLKISLVEHDRAMLMGEVPEEIFEIFFEDEDDEVEIDVDVYICRSPIEIEFLTNLTLPALKNIMTGILDNFLTLSPQLTQSIKVFWKIKMSEVQFFQNWTELSLSQVEGLQSICRPIRGNSPFILHGGPGTGKSRIFCFAIAYLLHIETETPFLVCTIDSNSVEKLMFGLREVLEQEVFENQVIRFDKPESVKITSWKRHCIITTLKTACTHFTKSEMPKFTDIIVEDINQFDETELWIQLAALVSEKTNLIFSGDPMERLCNRKMNLPHNLAASNRNPFDRYIKSGYVDDIRLASSLTESHTSNQTIMKYLSSLFYDKKLTSCTPPIKEYEEWSGLSTKKFPILFVSVPKTKCLFGPVSYRNELEARIVLKYVRQLTDLIVSINTRYRRQGYTAVENDSIGIFTPYQYQSQLIKNMMVLDGRHFVIEAFEGGPRKCVLISLTRHDKCPENAEDLLRNALAKTKHLLIIVGDHKLVYHLPSWKKLIDECLKNNSLIYCEQSCDPENITSLLK